MDIKDRLTSIRSHYNLTTRDFGKRINITGGAVTNMEKGARAITDRTIADICREFSVNELWLRTGTGDMLSKIPQEEIDRLAERFKLKPLAKKIVQTFVTLEGNEMDVLLDFVKEIASEDNGVEAENNNDKSNSIDD